MEKIAILINAPKGKELLNLRQNVSLMNAAEGLQFLIIDYGQLESTSIDFPVFSVQDHEDVSLTQLLNAIPSERFLFFDLKQNYPADFFERLLNAEEEEKMSLQKGSLWEESLIAAQQSHFGLYNPQSENLKPPVLAYLPSVLYTKMEVEKLNTDKVNMHPDLALELYRYAEKKKLKLVRYSPKKEIIHYKTNFPAFMVALTSQAQKQMKVFPVLFSLFFFIFGLGAAFNPIFLLVFLVGMGAYLFAVTLEAFGLSSIKKNGALMPILFLLFPFIHLVYGIESLIAKFKTGV